MATERQSGEGGTNDRSRPERHRWAIDRVEEGTAAVEQDADHLYEIPRFMIPAAARDGDVLAVEVTRAEGDGGVTITIRLDAKGTDTVRAASARRRQPRRQAGDPGGDISL